MPLESLSNEQINIHNLTLEKEKKPELGWREKFEKLQNSPLYDRDKEAWFTWDEDRLDFYVTSDQFLGAIVESKMMTDTSEFLLNKLRESFYNKEADTWYQHTRDSAPNNIINAFAIILESGYDPRKAMEDFDEMKREYFDSEKCQWLTGFNYNDDQCFTDDQLIPILAECYINKDSAKESLDLLKKTDNYNPEEKIWQSSRHNNRRRSSDELYEVLIEAHLNPDKARKQFNRLKLSNLYDSEDQMWFSSEEESYHDSTSQLLDILINQLIEERNITPAAPTIPLPETRNY